MPRVGLRSKPNAVTDDPPVALVAFGSGNAEAAPGRAAQLRALVNAARKQVIRSLGPMTPLGRAIGVIGVIAWVVAALFGWQEWAIIAAACLLGLLIGFIFTFGRTAIAVTTLLSPKRVVAGQRSVAELSVTNTSNRRMLPVRLEVPVGPALARVAVPSLAGGEAFEETIVIPTLKRSVLAVGPTRSVRGDPLGMMRREIVWTDSEELFVHPETNALAGVTSGWMRDLEGNPTNDRSPSDVELHTLREYVPGDDRRHVHWRTSARIGKLMVRQFIDNRRSHLGIIVDTNPASYAADAEEFELAVSIAGSLGLKAIRDGQETSCVCGSRGVNSHNGQALLDGLARVELGVPAISIQETAMRAGPLLNAASIIAIVTGSALSVADVQLASQRFGYETQIIVVRASLSGDAGFVRGARFLTLQADTLDSFGRVMVAVTS